jgi:CIC family chloride channel protein
MEARLNKLLRKFLVWRIRHMSQQTFVYLLSILVGFITGLAAVTLKNSTHYIQHLVSTSDYHNYFYFAFPVIGIVITVVIKRAFSSPVGEGIPSTLYAISKRNGILARYKMYASMVTSAITVGFGGSVGLEGPAVSTGSAIGSNLGKVMHLDYITRILLISCATAGAIATIFNAPIAAIIFTIEIFSLDLTIASLIPLLLASVSGSVTSFFIENRREYLLSYKLTDAFSISELPAYILLGIICALISVYFTKMYFQIEGLFGKVKKPMYKTILGGLVLGFLIFLIPPLYGEGYTTINNILNGNLDNVFANSFFAEFSDNEYMVLALFAGLVIFKVFATSLTIGAGGVGGVFAPSLFMGSSVGFIVARALNFFNFSLSESNFALAGMAGLMAGVMHAPLTAIFMIAEITGGYQLIIPLMITASLSFIFTKYFLPHTIYTKQLARRGELITHDKDKAILTLMNMREVIENDFIKVKRTDTLGDLVEIFKRSQRNLFPVVDNKNRLTGVLTLDDFKQLLFDASQYDKVKVSDLMYSPPAVIQTNDNMDEVMKKFQRSNAWNLPVTENGEYKGFISKSKLFSAYRRKLQQVSRS